MATSGAPPSPRMSDIALRLGVGLAVSMMILILLLPMLGVLFHTPIGALVARIGDPVVIRALQLSVLTSLAATVIVAILALPLAYLLATRAFPGKRVLEALIDLPMVLPPTVAGLALLLAFGRNGLL